MAGYRTETRAAIAFKKLIGLANTSDNFAFFNESIPSQVSIFSDEIIGEIVDSDPQVAVNDGIVEFIEADLTLIGSANGYAYNIRFPSTYNGSFGTSAQGELIRDYTQIITQKLNADFAEPSHNGGYGYDLYNDGNRVSPFVDERWFVDPVATVLTSDETEDKLNLVNGTIRLYVYTGKFLNEAIDIASTQIAVGGDGPVLNGDSNFTFDGSTFSVGADQVIGNGGTFSFNTGNSNSTSVSDISTDQNLGGNSSSDDFLVTQKAVKEYVDSQTGGGGTNGGVKIQNDGSTVLTGVKDINFGSNLEAVDDGDGSVTVNSLIDREFIQDTVMASIFGGEDITVTYNDSFDRLDIELDEVIDLGTLS